MFMFYHLQLDLILHLNFNWFNHLLSNWHHLYKWTNVNIFQDFLFNRCLKLNIILNPLISQLLSGLQLQSNLQLLLSFFLNKYFLNWQFQHNLMTHTFISLTFEPKKTKNKKTSSALNIPQNLFYSQTIYSNFFRSSHFNRNLLLSELALISVRTSTSTETYSSKLSPALSADMSTPFKSLYFNFTRCLHLKRHFNFFHHYHYNCCFNFVSISTSNATFFFWWFQQIFVEYSSKFIGTSNL